MMNKTDQPRRQEAIVRAFWAGFLSMLALISLLGMLGLAEADKHVKTFVGPLLLGFGIAVGAMVFTRTVRPEPASIGGAARLPVVRDLVRDGLVAWGVALVFYLLDAYLVFYFAGAVGSGYVLTAIVVALIRRGIRT